MEWAIEHVKTYGKPVAATICIGPNGDEDGVPLGKDLFRNGQENSILTCPYAGRRLKFPHINLKTKILSGYLF